MHKITKTQIIFKRRIGQKIDSKNCIFIDLHNIIRALMSSIFQIPHRACKDFESTMKKYLHTLGELKNENYHKLFFILTYLFNYVTTLTDKNRKEKYYIFKHHITFIIFKAINIDIKKPKKIGTIPQISKENIDEIYNKIKNLLEDSANFENLIKQILKK